MPKIDGFNFEQTESEIASEPNNRFDADERRHLFRWLNDIEESAPWGRGRRRRRFTPT
jgi:hypothetical protein